MFDFTSGQSFHYNHPQEWLYGHETESTAREQDHFKNFLGVLHAPS